MKEINHDDERLAALLGGRLEGPEREELLAHLLANDEDYQVFADTAAILQDADDEASAQAQQPGEQATPHPPFRETAPPSVRPGWRRRAPRWIAIPVILVGLVVSSIFVSRSRAAASEPLRVAARLDPGQRLPPGLTTGTRPWSTRGSGADAQRAAQGVRAGALLTDLAIAVRSGDPDPITRLAAQLGQYDPQGSALQQIQVRPDASTDALQPLLKDAEERLEGLFEPDPVRLGAWTEAARLAAGARDAEFFRTGPTQQMLRRADRFTRENGEAQRALAEVRAHLSTDESHNWQVLAAGLTTLLGEMAS